MRISFAILAGLLLVASAAAQDREGGERRARSERGFRTGGGPPTQMIVERLTQTLGLDEEQRVFLQQLADEQQQRMQERRELWGSLREAEESGDTARAEELRAALEGFRRDPGAEFGEMFAQLRTVLREDQIVQLDEMQTRMRGRNQQMFDAMRMARELPDVLNLNEEQRDQFRAILDDQRNAVREAMQERRRMAEESGEPMQEFNPDFDALRTEFLNRITEILDAEQQQALTAYVADFDARRGEEGRDGRDRNVIDLRSLTRATQRLELDADQKDQIREITQAAARADREISRRDAEGKAALVAETKKNILEVLTPEQTQQFERLLAAGDRGGRERMDRRGGEGREEGERGESRRPRRGRDGD